MKVVFILGSKVDMDHAEKMTKPLHSEWGIAVEVIVASAHKVPRVVADLVEKNNSLEDLVYVTIAGRSNALSGVVAANSLHPVFACPPFADKVDMMVNLNSTLMMPSETPVITVIDPSNTVLAIARVFALKDAAVRAKVEKRMADVKASF